MSIDPGHRGIVRLVAGLIAIAMSAFHMWVVAFGAPEPVIFRATHLLFAMLLVFLWFRMSGDSTEQPSLLDYALLIAGAIAVGYQLYSYEYIIGRMYYVDDLKPIDWVLAIVLIATLLEATRRTIGPALPITALVFIAYALLVARVEPQRFLDQAYLTTEGIFGIPLSVSASYVMIFVLFGSFMERTGTGQLFMDFALSLTGHTAGGPGKVSVVSSSLFGTISGSAVANVMVDGPISIPLMKRTGFKAHFAAAVEAVASTGGQIMPPIMGAAAFVMAEFLRVGYLQVVVWALIPSILYYVACFYAVHFEAKRQGIVGLPRSELPRLGQTLKERGHLFIPVLTILAIMYSGYSAPMAALGGTLLCFPAAWFGPIVLLLLPLLILAPHLAPKIFPALVPTFTASGFIEAAIITALVLLWTYRTWGRIVLLPIQGWPIIESMIDAAKNGLGVAMACACAGIIIGIISLTGVGLTFTQFVVGLAQNTLLLALVLTMVAGIIL
ncbi:MAG TPA: TRAP transporter fused permease subunit, partial [Hyphomicrobiaceae bacterium]|nr:TRAP transporter fused permease subunit [Hyphomicrobiaceae bacterium]